MLVYAKELLHSFQSLLFLLVFLFFLYLFVCLFVCFYLRVLPDRMLCLEPWLEHFSNTPFFFSHLIHTCVVNAVDLTIRVAGMLDLFFFLHVFVGNQSKRRWFKFWKKKLCRNYSYNIKTEFPYRGSQLHRNETNYPKQEEQQPAHKQLTETRFSFSQYNRSMAKSY